MNVTNSDGDAYAMPVPPPSLTPITISGAGWPSLTEILAGVPGQCIRVYRVDVENVGGDAVATVKSNSTDLPGPLNLPTGNQRMLQHSIFPLWQTSVGEALKFDADAAVQLDLTFWVYRAAP
jgi:hypothetical protein